jgi:hypothetical protein
MTGSIWFVEIIYHERRTHAYPRPPSRQEDERHPTHIEIKRMTSDGDRVQSLKEIEKIRNGARLLSTPLRLTAICPFSIVAADILVPSLCLPVSFNPHTSSKDASTVAGAAPSLLHTTLQGHRSALHEHLVHFLHHDREYQIKTS